MTSLRHLLRSPLGRHPRLLLRKIASRLGLRSNTLPPQDAPVTSVEYPETWRTALQQAAGSISLEKPSATFPFHRVFGQDFEEALLLELCRHGPRQGEKGLTGDIKLIWDFSRAHALWVNALHGQAEANAAFIKRWCEANEDLNGPAWTCAMDVAIRAVNWVYSDVMTGGQTGRLAGVDWARRLWLHGHVIWQRLEATTRPNNHYLADLLGLAVVGSIFPADPSARSWRNFARSEFPRALLNQTRSDGGLNEASARYHVFVTEMALLTRLALAEPFPAAGERRLQQMCQIIADLRTADGDVFALGDDDSGQVLHLNHAEGEGRADGVLRLASAQLNRTFQSSPNALYADSGWWVRRAGDFVVAMEFGGVGLGGQGAHAHNDDLSICLEWRGHPVIVDPGTFVYTTDSDARNHFRSVRAHSTVSIADEEPRELSRNVFQLPGNDPAFPTESVDDSSRSFSRPVKPGITHERTVRIEPAGVILSDRLGGRGRHRLHWRFCLHPTVQAVAQDSMIYLTVPGAGRLRLQYPPGTSVSLEAGIFSPGYGRKEGTTMLVIRLEVELPSVWRWEFRS